MKFLDPEYQQIFFPYTKESLYNLQPENNVVYVWKAPYRELLRASAYMEKLLSGDERSRAFSYTNLLKREYYICGRLFLRSVLAEHTGIEPAQLILSYSKSGKPFLDQCQNSQKLFFNLSHSKDVFLLAVAYRRELGVDLEFIRPVYQLEMIARHYFSKTEQRELALTLPKNKDALFMRFWVRREAYLKLYGLTVVTQITGDGSRSEKAAACTNYIQTFRPAENYIAALALAGSQVPLLRGYYPLLPVEPTIN